MPKNVGQCFETGVSSISLPPGVRGMSFVKCRRTCLVLGSTSWTSELNCFLFQSAKAYLSFIDVSVGQKVAGFTTGLGRSDVMCQNPKNAIIHLGHSGGTRILAHLNNCFLFCSKNSRIFDLIFTCLDCRDSFAVVSECEGASSQDAVSRRLHQSRCGRFSWTVSVQ